MIEIFLAVYRIVIDYSFKYEDFYQSIKNDLILNETLDGLVAIWTLWKMVLKWRILTKRYTH